MNLHRALEHEWSHVPADQYNTYQRIAAHTNGLITPGNAVSLSGFMLVAAGLVFVWQGSLALGLALLLIGRLADLFDGMIAHATKTKSPVGEAVDATIDKIVALAALTVLSYLGLVPFFIGALFLLHNITNVCLFGLARLRGTRLHPNRTGKLSTAGEWLAVVGFTLVYGFGPQTHQYDNAKVGLYIFSGVMLAMGLVSVINYAHHVFTRNTA